MLYAFAKVIMWTTLHFYFRRIVFSGKKEIPEGKPAILIANHSASFLDAMLLAVLMKRPLFFYARSDIFKKNWANKILRSFHMIPIYTFDHGKENLHKNQDTFAEGEDVLSNKGLLLIFPEGTSRVERIMLPLKKGTARVALQTESKHDFKLGLSIIPVGINYSAHSFRANIHIQVGEPTMVAPYELAFKENSNKAINQLNQELEGKFADTIIYVQQPERTDMINRLLELYRHDTFRHNDNHTGMSIMSLEKKICQQVTEMDEEETAKITGILKRYDELLGKNKLIDTSVNGRYHLLLWHFFLLIIGLPFFLLSFILNIIPLIFAKWVADKTVTRIDFYTSVANASGGFGYFIWWVLLMIAAAFIGNTWVWIAVLSAPILLFLGMFWWEGFRDFLAHSRYLVKKWNKSTVIVELAEMRSKVSFWKK
jgi:glycerol-3-phosphate O-acyltransferase / dihydroxyacetone phosphate acyltransferase